MIRLVVVDDHPIVREGLVTALEDQSDFEVIGAAQTAQEALELAAQRTPDVMLLDLELAGENALNHLAAIQARCPTLRILIFTAYDTEERAQTALEAGAKGYLLKGAPIAEIARAIRVIANGGVHLEPRLAARMLGCPRPVRLTERERDTLRLTAEGLSNKQIAHRLGVTERTVKFHLTSLFAKLGAENRAQAVALAAQRGLV